MVSFCTELSVLLPGGDCGGVREDDGGGFEKALAQGLLPFLGRLHSAAEVESLYGFSY